MEFYEAVRMVERDSAWARLPQSECVELGAEGDVMYRDCSPLGDALVMPLWLLSNGLVIYFARSVALLFLTDASLPQTALGVLLIYVATVVGAATFLGSFGVLAPWLLISLAAIVSVGGIGVLRRLRRRGHAAAGSILGREAKGKIGPEKGSVVTWICRGWVLLGGCLLGHILINGLLAFPKEWDGLAYHIPLIDHWLQARNLCAPDSATWWTSANAELLSVWLVAPFSGDFLIAIGNLPWLVIWVLAALEVARLLGLSFAWRNLAVLAMLAVHTTLHEAEKAMNDIAVAACFFAAAAYGFRYFESTRPADLALAGVATGLLAGVKYFALGYAAVLGGAVVGGTVVSRGLQDARRAVVVLTSMASPFGAYWYLRNYFVAGAPLYPQGGDVAGTGYPDLWGTTLIGNGSPDLLPLSAEALWNMTGPCHLAAVLLVPLVLLTLLWSGASSLRRGDRGRAAIFAGFGALLVGTAAVFILTPFCVEDQPGTLNQLRWAYTPARYGLCFLSVAVLAAAWLLQRCAEKASSWSCVHVGGVPAIKVACPVVFAVSAAWQSYLRVFYLYRGADLTEGPDLLGATLMGLSLVLAGWLAAEVWWATPRHRRALITLGAVCLLCGASIGVEALSRRWHEGFARHFDTLRGSRVFTHLAEERGSLTIAVLDCRSYPFFGSARQHRVVTPRILTTYDDLVVTLAACAPDVVASPRHNMGQVFDPYKQAPEWLATHTSEFKPLMMSGDFGLFSFVQGVERSGGATAHVVYDSR